MKRSILLLGLLMTLLIAGPSFAGDPNYASDRLSYWLEYADNQGYTVYYTAIDTISADQTFTYDLEVDSGGFYVVAEAGEDIVDLDMSIYDAYGSDVARAGGHGSSPQCSFFLDEGTLLDIEFDVGAILGDATEDYFSLIVMKTAPGEGGWGAGDQGDLAAVRADLDEYMAMVTRDGCQDVFDIIRLCSSDMPTSFEITLGQGDYVAYAGGGPCMVDLDMRVYDAWGYVVSEDVEINKYPVCEFGCDESSSFTIEVDPYQMAAGCYEAYIFLVVARR